MPEEEKENKKKRRWNYRSYKGKGQQPWKYYAENPEYIGKAPGANLGHCHDPLSQLRITGTK